MSDESERPEKRKSGSVRRVMCLTWLFLLETYDVDLNVSLLSRSKYSKRGSSLSA